MSASEAHGVSSIRYKQAHNTSKATITIEYAGNRESLPFYDRGKAEQKRALDAVEALYRSFKDKRGSEIHTAGVSTKHHSRRLRKILEKV